MSLFYTLHYLAAMGCGHMALATEADCQLCPFLTANAFKKAGHSLLDAAARQFATTPKRSLHRHQLLVKLFAVSSSDLLGLPCNASTQRERSFTKVKGDFSETKKDPKPLPCAHKLKFVWCQSRGDQDKQWLVAPQKEQYHNTRQQVDQQVFRKDQ